MLMCETPQIRPGNISAAGNTQEPIVFKLVHSHNHSNLIAALVKYKVPYNYWQLLIK